MSQEETDTWVTIHEGEYDGRYVELTRYGDSNDVCVTTTHASDDVADAYSDGHAKVIPALIFAGERMEIHANAPEDLKQKLLAEGFSAISAGEISRHAKLPTAD